MFLLTWQILFPTDYLLMPFFVLGWFLLLRVYRDAKYKNSIVQKYFIPAMLLRLVGALLTAMMYQYYYGGGDTYYYYFGMKDIYNAYFSNPFAAYEMIFVEYGDWSPVTFDAVTLRRFFTNPTEATVIQIAGVLSPLGLGTFIGTSFALSILSFAGCWALYRVFVKMYPHLHYQLALAILFLPSIWFWSTGIMKDSIVIAGLGFFVNGIYYGIISKEKKLLRSIFLILVGAWLMKSVKVYVLAAILPATVIWVFFMLKERIKNDTLRKIASPLFFGVGFFGGAFVIQQLGNTFAQFSFEGFMEEAVKTQWWLKVSTERDGGTGYDLGTMDPSLAGLLRTFPRAVNVTLFRPYPWEARKIIVLPSAAEALFTLLFTLYVFFKVGLVKFFKHLIGDPVILFCLVFAIIFAFSVGFTAFNFGALARYKIPCLPFYYCAMILMLDKVRNPEGNIKQNQVERIDSNLKPSSV